jgi:hypothetical protein
MIVACVLTGTVAESVKREPVRRQATVMGP